MAQRSKRTAKVAASTAKPSASRASSDRARVAELEAELKAAQKTISALLDKVDRQDAAATAESVETAARLERVIASRTREVEQKIAEVEAANLERRRLMANLDQIVRQRNRALIESEAQLRRKNEELRRLNEMKTEFISIAAHELRTPLTSIVGYLDLMSEGAFGRLSAALSRPVDSLRRNVSRLVRLVEDLLDVTRIEAGKMQLDRQPIDLTAVVREVVEVLAPIAAAKHNTLVTEFEDSPLPLAGDADKLGQVVTNLMSNAIRYSPENAPIETIVDRAPRDQFAGSWARLRVRDHGVGIPRDQRDRIFEPFADIGSAKHHTSSVPDSAGLGLYIARGLVDLHGGIITVDSEEGCFTEFTVLLPLSESAGLDA